MLVVRRRRRIFGQWEKNTNNAFHRMLNLMDPYPMKRYQSLTYTQVQAVLDAHDEEREVLMKARLDEFSESFLRMTFYEQPRRPRRASKHIAPVRRPELLAPPTIMGFSKKTIAARIRAEGAGTVDAPTPGPVDPFAGWYANHDDDARLDLKPGSKDTTSPGHTSGTRTKLVWGWVANTTVRVDSDLPARRKVRGFTAAQTFLTLALTNYNLRKIAAFLHDEILGAMENHTGTPAEPIVRRRDRIWYNPYTKTTPRESVLELAKAGLLSSPLRT